MAFVSSLSVSVAPVRASSKVCAVRGACVAVAPARAARGARSGVVRMDTKWSGDYPPSVVLGLGQNVPSSLYALASVPALLLGCFGIYQSNFAHILTPDTVNPQFILASLLVPISWGLHVAAWIQKENGK
jgi:hypothetical protein